MKRLTLCSLRVAEGATLQEIRLPSSQAVRSSGNGSRQPFSRAAAVRKAFFSVVLRVNPSDKRIKKWQKLLKRRHRELLEAMVHKQIPLDFLITAIGGKCVTMPQACA